MDLRHDEAQFFALKTAIEELLGHQAWLDLKECTNAATWRRYFLKLIQAMRVSIEASVEIADPTWRNQVRANLDRGATALRKAKGVEELLSILTATLLRQTFLQIGFVPNRIRATKVSLSRENWRLSAYRSVIYVQSASQVEALFWTDQQRLIGFPRQRDLHEKHRKSGSRLPFSEWCKRFATEQCPTNSQPP